ncbi:NAD-dependent succinate-semialdehyde dehydrogenase [Nocardia pseudovaccinii]|uniref:NAD-dependent succinate-semialdehyde dehydrogenase n=1 Tax=Nocardia pseudovaccinii TaxID=189540 RepID=UPI003D8DDFDF
MTATNRMALGAEQSDALANVQTGLLIGGWRTVLEKLPVENPATGKVIAEVADGTADDGVEALDAAVRAQRGWAATTARYRADVLHHLYAAVIESREELALLITTEMGKPLAEARGEVDYAADYVRWYAEEAVRLDGRSLTTPNGRSEVVTYRGPVGPCLLITPWNFPLAMGLRKVAPALAAGCTVVWKPADLTPLTALRAASLMLEAGVPEGVVNVVTTTDAASFSATVMADPRLRKVSFTGSTPVGRRLLAQASEGVLKSSMELGGNAPLLVLEDADVDRAVEGAFVAKLRNGGQSCVAANRMYVHEKVADAFVEAFAARVARVAFGNGMDAATDLGPLIDGRAVDKVAGLVTDAVARGAKVLAGGVVPDGPGYFYPATVLDHVAPGSRLLGEEIFGPVAPIVRFQDEGEAILHANATPFGLAAYLFTENGDRARRVAAALDAGMVGVNQGAISDASVPFGGVKQSGLGREGGAEGIEDYTELKFVSTPSVR